MKRLFMLVLAGLIAVSNMMISSSANAQILGTTTATLNSTLADQTNSNLPFIQQLKTQVLPKIEKILTSEQSEQLEAAILKGETSLRKVFKSITLSPDQKFQLATVLKSLPKRDTLAALTPEEKKQFFMKNKEAFMPTAESINEKINASMKMKRTTLPEGVSEKISAKMKNAEQFMPTPETIGEKINAGMKMMQDKMAE
ncbi:MAG: hypothetical protein DCF22_01495 [Leptolyngbya sp.]|nr:MAG: hypothetical protein DCF22_01495 [Leptolyngbya sp.]